MVQELDQGTHQSADSGQEPTTPKSTEAAKVIPAKAVKNIPQAVSVLDSSRADSPEKEPVKIVELTKTPEDKRGNEDAQIKESFKAANEDVISIATAPAAIAKEPARDRKDDEIPSVVSHEEKHQIGAEKIAVQHADMQVGVEKQESAPKEQAKHEARSDSVDSFIVEESEALPFDSQIDTTKTETADVTEDIHNEAPVFYKSVTPKIHQAKKNTEIVYRTYYAASKETARIPYQPKQRTRIAALASPRTDKPTVATLASLIKQTKLNPVKVSIETSILKPQRIQFEARKSDQLFFAETRRFVAETKAAKKQSQPPHYKVNIAELLPLKNTTATSILDELNIADQLTPPPFVRQQARVQRSF